MALTDEQRARFNAKSAQKKTQGTVQNNNSDASDYQEFLRFKEMKRQQELQKQAAERQAAMQQQAILRQQQEELRRQQEEIQRQRFELEQEKQAHKQWQYQESQQIPHQNSVHQPQQTVNQLVGKDGLTTKQRLTGWAIFFVLICAVYLIINGGSLFRPKTNTSAKSQQNIAVEQGTASDQSMNDNQNATNEQAEIPSQSTVVNDSVLGEYYTVGDTVDVEGVLITFTDFTVVEPSFGSTDGNFYVQLGFDVLNNTDTEISFNGIANIRVYCDEYEATRSGDSRVYQGRKFLSGDHLSVGKKTAGIICLKMPVDYKQLEIVVSNDRSFTKTATFMVLNGG